VRRRLILWLGVLAVAVAGTAGLVRLAETGGTVFRVEGEVLHMAGPVTGAAADRLERTLEQNPGLRLLVLGDIPGGDDTTWLIGMASLIRQAGLATRADGEVVNDGILLFAAGVTREIGAGRLVLTDAGTARMGGLPFDTRPAAAQERARYSERMLGSAALAELMARHHGGAGRHVLTEGELAETGLIGG
jgi:hypothetical protein